MLKRCPWAGDMPLYQQYHDHEWGRACFDEQKLFEMLCLEGAQAGLSWWTILQKREHYRSVFDDFAVHKIAQYDEKKSLALLEDAGIVRNKLKVNAFIKNARAWLALSEKENIVDWLWQAVAGKPMIHYYESQTDIPSQTPQSEMLSKRLKKAGFSFVGPTIVQAYMQAVGMFDDHLVSCPCHSKNRM